MANDTKYKSLTDEQIKTLVSQGCCCADWSGVRVSGQFDPAFVVNAAFVGQVRLGSITKNVSTASGIDKTGGVYNAMLCDCTVGDNTLIANVGVHIANYDIAENVAIENVATMQTNPGATFGNGTEVDVLNEAGGREVTLFDELSSQFAYMLCLHRHRPELIKKLKAIAADYAASVTSNRGTVAADAKICSAGEIIDVNIGQAAIVNGPASLVNGTILSSAEAPATVGNAVTAKNFIIAESAQVTEGAILHGVFVGQGCQVGKQFSAENSLFFANSEMFHGEACSVFAGPYTVSHHKSTLLIAGLFSFYNAGSGTNQSNHMYKLGPCHEGKVLRGTKTGSYAYMMWPCKVGPFSVVLGKHSSTFDTTDFPFSHIEARQNGKCVMIPGLHLTTVGTVRDGAKWAARDRRKGPLKRDIISFDMFSPYSVGKMLKGTEELKKIQDATDRSIEEVSVGGALVRRPILRTGQKFYRTGIEMYLSEKVVEKCVQTFAGGTSNTTEAMKPKAEAVYDEKWVDICGQMMPAKRLIRLQEAIEAGSVANIKQLNEELQKIDQAYDQDEWAWVVNTYKKVFDVDLTQAGKDKLTEAADKLLAVKGKFLKLVVADAEKEFAELSRCGFGQDGTEADRDKDFQQVRGLYDDNKFVKQMRANLEQLQSTVEDLKKKLAKM